MGLASGLRYKNIDKRFVGRTNCTGSVDRLASDERVRIFAKGLPFPSTLRHLFIAVRVSFL